MTSSTPSPTPPEHLLLPAPPAEPSSTEAANVGVRPLGSPLRVEALRRRLAGSSDASVIVARALAIEARLQDATARAASTDRSAVERVQATAEVVGLRAEFDALVAQVRLDTQPDLPPELPPELRMGRREAEDSALLQRFAFLLGVPVTPEYRPLLAVKIAEYGEQGSAFEEIAEAFGFLDGVHLGRSERRGALVLTDNGSLVQVSSPKRGARRRYIYQNLYGGKTPAEGTLELLDAIRPGRPLLAGRFMTSPVRKLRVAVRPDVWDEERKAFDRIRKSLVERGGADRRSTLWGVDPGWLPSFVRKPADSESVERAAAPLRRDLRALIERLADASLPAADPTHEARALSLCTRLQQLLSSTGAPRCKPSDLRALVTERGERCEILSLGQRPTVCVARPGRTPVTIERASFADQIVVRGAPVAVLDDLDRIAAVLGDVASIDRR